MSKNIFQIFSTNPAASMQGTDLLYLGRSPYGVNDDFGITWTNMLASITAGAAGGSNTQVQYNNNGALAGDSGFTTNGSGTLNITTQLTVANTRMSSSTLTTVTNDSNLTIDPAGAGIVTINNTTAFTSKANGGLQVIGLSSDGFNGAIAAGSFGSLSGGNFNGFRSRAAAPGSFSKVLPGDLMARVQCYADDGVQFTRCGIAEWVATGTISSAIVPTEYLVQIMNSSGTLVDAFRVLNNQTMQLPQPLPIASGGLAVTTTPTNGQIPIGNGTNYTVANITAGTGVSITNGSGSITINAGGGGLSWTTIAGTTQAAAVNNGYVAGNAAQTTVTLPATAAIGDTVAVEGLGAGGWILAANTGQTIKIGSQTTSSAGSLTSAAASDNVYVTCIVANTTWRVRTTNSAGLTYA